MASSLSNSKKDRNHFGRQNTRPMSEINVTPFVDVMLVLLVIFMVTAPLLTVGVQVNLPKTKSTIIDGSDEPLAVSIDSGGVIFIQDSEVQLNNLIARLEAISERNKEVRVFVRADEAINYGRVMSVMGLIAEAGYSRIALITRTKGAPTLMRKGTK